MQNANLNSGTLIFKIRNLTFFNNPISHAKRFHFKSQTHIEHKSAEMNTQSA